MALTKSSAALDAIFSLASAAISKGAAGDISTAYHATIGIWYAPTATTANTLGASAIIQVNPSATAEDKWLDYTIVGFGNTTSAVPVITVSTSTAGNAVLNMSGTPTGLVAGDKVFIKNGTLANSEFGQILSVATNDLTMMDAITRDQDGSVLSDQAEFKTVQISALSYSRIRVMYTAPTGPACVFQSELSVATGL
jgi:hypothetical protein